jgi:flagellar FliJ protein
MSRWVQSLIRISDYEVQTLQKRLAEIVGRRVDAEMRIVMLEAESEAEARHAEADAEAGFMQLGFTHAVRMRKAEIQITIDALLVEETGARDALSVAFEDLKRYEHVAEAQKVKAAKLEQQRETAALDELGLRRPRQGPG